jgi:hypothetical protein
MAIARLLTSYVDGHTAFTCDCKLHTANRRLFVSALLIVPLVHVGWSKAGFVFVSEACVPLMTGVIID